MGRDASPPGLHASPRGAGVGAAVASKERHVAKTSRYSTDMKKKKD